MNFHPKQWILILVALGAFQPLVFSQNNSEALRLMEELKKSDRQIRYDAAVSLAKLGEKALPSAIVLAHVLDNDPDVYVRAKAAQALGNIGWQAAQLAVPNLIHVLKKDNDMGVQYQTIQALGKMLVSAHEAGPYLEKFLKSPHPHMRYQAAYALGRIEYAEAHPKLSKLLTEDPSEDVRMAAAQAIDYMPFSYRHLPEKKTPLPALIQALKDTSPQVRIAAAKALSRFGYFKSPIPALGSVLQDPEPKIRVAALTSLLSSHQNYTPILSQLITALSDREAAVRHRAAILVSLFPEKKDLAMPHLIEALRNEEPDVRKEAISYLRTVGEKDPTLVPHLFENVFTHDPDMQSSIVNGLIGFSQNDASITSRLLDLLEYADINYEEKLKILQYVGKGNVKTPEILEKIAKHLTSTDRMIRQSAVVALEELRDKMDGQQRGDFERSLKHILTKENSPNVCRTLCHLANSPSVWVDNHYLHPDFSFDETDPWGYALQNLGALFVTKSASFCPDAQPIVDGIISSLTAQDSNNVSLPETCDSLTFPFSHIQKFANSILTTPGVADTAPKVYGNQFLLLLISEIFRNHHEKLTDAQRLKLDSLYQKARNHLNMQLSHAPQSYTKKGEGSLFNTYAIATSLLPDSITLGPVGRGYLQQAIDPNNPLRVAYNPSYSPENERGSAARAVPTYLALYRTEISNPEQKERYRTDLKYTLENYVRYLPTLMSHLRRGSVLRTFPGEDGKMVEGYSPHSGSDFIAPYYLYSTIPYATAAVQSLLQENRSEAEKEQLLELKRDLKTAILSLVNDNGLFYTPEYSASPGYVDPLFGLALIPLAEECVEGKAEDKVDPFALKGILDW